MRVLIVEDEPKLADIIARCLQGASFEVEIAGSIAQAQERLSRSRPDLVLLDLLLPDGSGTGLIAIIRTQWRDLPILVLTARADLKAKIENFEAGADDYLTKPFALPELLVRVNALLRRANAGAETILRFKDLELDRLSQQVRRSGKRIDLSRREYALLELLILNAGQPVSRSMISDKIWGKSLGKVSNIVDVYVNLLRNKMDEDTDKKLIKTVRGLGYMIDDQDA
jgi:two-component system copper resistance phosphate regulon response regulator CusR